MKKLLAKLRFSLLVVTLFFISGGQALAYDYYQNLQWPFYDANTQAAVEACATATVNLTGNSNAQKAFNYFVGQGLTPPQAAGILGNLMQESSVVPTKIQNGGESQNPDDAGGGGYGIAQWTPGHKLIDTASSYKITGPIYELSTQLDVIWAQLKGSSPTGAQNMLATLKTINDPVQAADYFEKYFEAAKDGGNLPQREANAVSALKEFGAGDGGTTPKQFTNSCGISTISPDCQSANGVAKILCAAKKYDPVSYEESTRGGHQGAAAWHQTCPQIGPSCVLDCSGLVNIAVYDVYGVDKTDNTDLERANTALWKPIPFSQLQPGDLIQPNTGHVEIVDHVEGSRITTFGAHTSRYPQPQQVGPSSFSDNSGNLYLHYIGPGSGTGQ